MKTQITALPVERDECGYWTHPDYAALFGERESVSRDEFKSLMDSVGVISHLIEMEYDAPVEVADAYFEGGSADISAWQPTKPKGDGWFIGSIHDTEDGPVAVWLKPKVNES
ncbi:hypothetical protein SOASR014_40590 [Pectobacterium carotovorum subsp. carotovorum]|nr:hypothetical protein SOASR014_40590 [Pectobacterium carotovorum subsp. carotovorum]GLX46407.1 hypothetical protein Pcaca01_40750 [Pectobacterium carotovorum subsp. carotovorum]